jgi:cytochrome c oxidase subunit 1
MPSPPPPYNFVRIPVVTSRAPLWEPSGREVTGIPASIHASLTTRFDSAVPDHIYLAPEPSIWPFLSALAVTGMFIASIFTPWGLVWGAIPVTITLIGWFWPSRHETSTHLRYEVKPELPA